MMPRATAAYAKNTIRRALRAVVDAEPDQAEVLEMWEHFGSRCAYCERILSKDAREGHVDHLVSTTAGGVNHISNRVLSCPPCNGDKKREKNWLDFLRDEAPNQSKFEERRARIDAWTKERASAGLCSIDLDLLNREIDRVILAFDAAVRNLRASRA